MIKYLPTMAGVKESGMQLAGQIQQYNSQCSRSDYVRASVVMAAAAYAVVMGSAAWAAASIALFSLVHGPTRGYLASKISLFTTAASAYLNGVIAERLPLKATWPNFTIKNAYFDMGRLYNMLAFLKIGQAINMILGIRPTIPAPSKEKDNDLGSGNDGSAPGNGSGTNDTGTDFDIDSGHGGSALDNGSRGKDKDTKPAPVKGDQTHSGSTLGGQGEASKPGADNDARPEDGELSNSSSQTDLGSSDADPQEDFVDRVVSGSGDNDSLSEDVNGQTTISGDARVIRSNNNTPVQASDIGSASKTDSDVEGGASMSGNTSDSNGFKSAANDSTERDGIPSPVAVSDKAPGGSQPKVAGASGVQGVNSGQETISTYSLWAGQKSKSSSRRTNPLSRKTQSGQTVKMSSGQAQR